jgi:fimbrial chaperone protein
MLLTLGWAQSAMAGNFSVTPVRIFMTPKDRAVAVTITNDGDEPLVMQADLYSWKQKADGEDELTLTEDIFLSPPIIKMAPKSRQVVRLARLNPIKSPDQQTYRMIVREIPEARPANEDLQLQIALAFSMPVFITPSNVKGKLDCQISQVETAVAHCQNSGNAYSHPVSLQLLADDGSVIATNESGGYLLPGTKRNFVLKNNKASTTPKKVKLLVTFDDASKQEYVIP